MSLEQAKSLVLTLLVLLSFMLTWGLWTYQPQYETLDDRAYLQEVIIGDKRSLVDILQPELVIFHENKEHYGLRDPEVFQAFAESVSEWKLKSVEDVSDSISSVGISSFIRQDNSVEFVFLADIPGQLFAEAFEIDDEIVIEQVDRMLLKWPNQTQDKVAIYLISSAQESVLKTTFATNGIDYLANYRANVSEYPKYFGHKIDENKYTYLPVSHLSVPKLTYSAQLISPIEFKNALFNNPSSVKQFTSDTGERTFTNSSSALEVFQNEMMMRYINPVNKQTSEMTSSDVIYSGIEFMNDHSGWTDNYRIDNYDHPTQTINYRMIVGELPVFDLKNITDHVLIEQKVRNGMVYEYTRSLINLRFKLENGRVQVDVPSGYDVLRAISSEIPNFDETKLENITIGYEFDPVGNQTAVIQFNPVWFIQYNGLWRKVQIEEDSSEQGGSVIGLEQNQDNFYFNVSHP
ncbi:YycH family regulatory protein [Bacillus solimangrovi]|uniref:Regulatory protein YycH domain-containing protein n=1 Tax=Bacillus solimangrovi TaxID=1305675 RepID=A0A1E5LG75_9BACI|nr:two-component system activity regulator YycH [Bacillus solimangrovi]OEH93079.1 hypothetical protein BFG57_13615 [Bacillus solimangrovi]